MAQGTWSMVPVESPWPNGLGAGAVVQQNYSVLRTGMPILQACKGSMLASWRGREGDRDVRVPFGSISSRARCQTTGAWQVTNDRARLVSRFLASYEAVWCFHVIAVPHHGVPSNVAAVDRRHGP